MNIRKSLLVFGLLLVVVVSYAQKPRYIKTKTYEGIVNTKPLSEKGIKSNAQLYIPTDSEIAMMEKKITSSIEKLFNEYIKHDYGKGNCDIVQNLPKFIRYYSGMYFYGEKVIIASFHRGLPKNWKINLQSLQGNGMCSNFVVEYNIKKDSLIGLFPGDE
jgi:hypothetical protein